MRRPERLPLSEEAAAEQKRLSEEYQTLFDSSDEPDEETSERLDAIEARIEELQDTGSTYGPDVLAIAGAIVTVGADGEPEVLRGIVRPEDEPEEDQATASKPRPEFSAALLESLTEAKSAAISATLAGHPGIALAAVVHAMAGSVFRLYGSESSLQLSAKVTQLREASKGAQELDTVHPQWTKRLPSGSDSLWRWCIEQEQGTLLELLAYCAAQNPSARGPSEAGSPQPRAICPCERDGHGAEARHDEVVHADGPELLRARGTRDPSSPRWPRPRARPRSAPGTSFPQEASAWRRLHELTGDCRSTARALAQLPQPIRA